MSVMKVITAVKMQFAVTLMGVMSVHVSEDSLEMDTPVVCDEEILVST